MTVRNLDDAVKQKLRQQAARHGRSMEAEARDILAKEVLGTGGDTFGEASAPAPSEGKFRQLRGLWNDRGSTDDLMRATRGDS